MSRKYNKMNTNDGSGEGDEAGYDGDDAQASKDSIAVKIGAHLLVPPPDLFRR
jgi:hypothetical protein